VARRFPVGLRVKDIRIGTGAIAAKGLIALVHYEAFLPRGDRLSTSRDRDVPVQFEIGRRRALPAFESGVVGMAVGGLRSVRVSPQLTYYERKIYPDLPENVALRYEIELIRLSDTWDNSVG
jgi:FKBP-type peptidyl-prolyl cis-trans isomerase